MHMNHACELASPWCVYNSPINPPPPLPPPPNNSSEPTSPSSPSTVLPRIPRGTRPFPGQPQGPSPTGKFKVADNGVMRVQEAMENTYTQTRGIGNGSDRFLHECVRVERGELVPIGKLARAGHLRGRIIRTSVPLVEFIRPHDKNYQAAHILRENRADNLGTC